MSEKTPRQEPELIHGEVLDQQALSLEELARACRVEPEWIVERLEGGLIDEREGQVHQWRFSSYHLRRTRRLCQLERDFEASPELAAFCADLLEEIERLRRLTDTGRH